MKQFKQIPKFKTEDEERKFWDNVENIFDYLDPAKFVEAEPPMVPKTDAMFLRMPHSIMPQAFINELAHQGFFANLFFFR